MWMNSSPIQLSPKSLSPKSHCFDKVLSSARRVVCCRVVVVQLSTGCVLLDVLCFKFASTAASSLQATIDHWATFDNDKRKRS